MNGLHYHAWMQLITSALATARDAPADELLAHTRAVVAALRARGLHVEAARAADGAAALQVVLGCLKRFAADVDAAGAGLVAERQ